MFSAPRKSGQRRLALPRMSLLEQNISIAFGRLRYPVPHGSSSLWMPEVMPRPGNLCVADGFDQRTSAAHVARTV
jgi:hypothetical protein